MNKIAFVIVLMLALNASAMGKFQDESMPPGAKPSIGEDLSEAPKEAPTKTNVTIERIIPREVVAGETFTVTLKVTNHYTGELNILVVDPQRQGITYIGGPEPYMAKYEGLVIPLFRWKDKIQPGEAKEYAYQIKASNPGTVTFPPATVNDDFGNTFESKPAFVRIDCKPTGSCDAGKNYVNCPADCPTGSKDEACDGVEDGRIDPDCVPGADPDSAKPATTTLPATKPLKKETQAPWCNLLTLPLSSLLLTALTRKIL